MYRFKKLEKLTETLPELSISTMDDAKSEGEDTSMSLDRTQLTEEDMDDESSFVVSDCRVDTISSNFETREPDCICSVDLTEGRNWDKQ